MANPMMMPNTMPSNNGMNGNMGGGMNGMNGNMGGTMMNPSMPYMQRMPSQGAAPSSSQRTTPSFVGLTRSEASALAAQYGMTAAFDGSTSENARVASQAPEAGALIFRSGMPIRFQMEMRASPPPAQMPQPAPETQAAPPTPAQAAAPAASPTVSPAAPAAQPSIPPAAPAKPAPAAALAPPPPAAPSRNWWILAAVAAALAGGLWALLGKRRKPAGFNNPPAAGMAQLAAQIVSTGLTEANVSLAGAAAPRLELSYVVERDPQSDQIGISFGGGGHGG
jgi:hypothetical protein